MMQTVTADSAAEPVATVVPVRAGIIAALVAAATVVPLLVTAGRLTESWRPAPDGIERVGDSAVHGTLLGLAVGLAIAATRPASRAGSPHRPIDAVLHIVGPGLAGALVGAGSGVATVTWDPERGTVAGLLLALATSVGFGALAGGAARLGGGDRGARSAAVVGGACGGFFVWLIANALHDSVTITSTLGYWRALAHDPALQARLLRYGAGAALPAMCVPLGITGADALRRLWRR